MFARRISFKIPFPNSDIMDDEASSVESYRGELNELFGIFSKWIKFKKGFKIISTQKFPFR